jgi:chorismate mutase
VDRIDLRILRLLQQRTKLSQRIGEAKRSHHAPVYVPERERELLQRIARRSRGKFSTRAAGAIFREILSSSRAEQGQAPIGHLRNGAALSPARWCFGACDRFEARTGWPHLARGLEDGTLGLVLLTGAELARVLQTPAARRNFQARFVVAGDFPGGGSKKAAPTERVFIILLGGVAKGAMGSRFLILIECKSKGDAVKEWAKSMPGSSSHVEQVTMVGRHRTSAALLRVATSRPQDARKFMTALASTDLPATILGVYHATEDDAE